MIEAKEIRYGNWVQNKNSYPICVNYHFFGMIERLGKDRSDAVHGIPLTAEIVEKCGFKHCDDAPGYYDNGVHYLEGIITPSVYFNFCLNAATAGRPLRYLHQLQNLYFALTGEELNVQL